MAQPIVVTLVADTHVNSTVGLLTEPVENDDQGTYFPSKAQLWLARCWQSVWDTARQKVQDYGALLYGVMVGDSVDLGVGFSTQIITKNPATILKMGITVFEPAVRVCDRFFFLRGTEVHTGGSGFLEEKIAQDLGAEPCPGTQMYSWWHLNADFGGVLFDLHHHGKMGRLPWTLTNGMATVAETVMSECVRHKRRIPDVAVRAHCHLSGDTGQNYPVRVVQLPAFQLCTAFSYKVFPDTLAHIGGAMAVVQDGHFVEDLHLIKFEPDNPVIWKESEAALLRPDDDPEEGWQDTRG